MLPADFFKKNMEMWEQFTQTYMDSMFKTAEKTMDQTKVFQEEMDKTINEAIATQMDLMQTSLQSIQRQVEDLNAKIDTLVNQEKAE